MKVVINSCYGGFSLSEEAYKFLGIPWDNYGFCFNDMEERTDPRLIECVETLGERANGSCAQLKVVEIPDDIHWIIEEYDGAERVSEARRTWS